MNRPRVETSSTGFIDDHNDDRQDDLRQKIAAVLLERSDVITSDAVAVVPFSGAEAPDPEYCSRIGELLVELLAFAVREGHIDARGGFVNDLHRMVLEGALSIERLFTFAYLTERTALDELALDQAIGATSEEWPLAAQLVRRASFDLLGAYTERAQLEPGDAPIADRLTTLYSRALLETVLAKEVDRAARFGYALALILFDVDFLSAINKEHGYGVGDKILERLGILIRGFFRQFDWVARHSEDAIAVLLTGTDAVHASDLAERVRATVEERLEFVDHLSGRPVKVTMSAAVIHLQASVGELIDPVRLMADAEAALDRAKRQGRNRVESVRDYSGSGPAASL